MLTLEQISNSVVLVRVAFDLPTLNDTARIKDALETIKLLLKNNNKVVLATKWGRPKGSDQRFSTQKMANVVETLVRTSILKELAEQGEAGSSRDLEIDQEWDRNHSYITFIDQFQGFEVAKEKIHDFKKDAPFLPGHGRLFILENTHFDACENSKDATQRLEIAKKYASLADYFVDESFASSHRNEATNTEIKTLLPWTFGLAYQNEVKNLDQLRVGVKQPFVVLMAGAKLETKLPLITKMLPKADKILLGGLLSFTFLQAAKELLYPNLPDIYESYVEVEFLEQAKELLLKNPEKLVLPLDLIYEETNVDFKLSENQATQVGKYGRDVGPKTVKLFENELQKAQTIFWNGTLGLYEKPPFDRSTRSLGDFIASLNGVFRVLGGGDTGSALPQEVLDRLDFVSMGGGATLEYLSH